MKLYLNIDMIPGQPVVQLQQPCVELGRRISCPNQGRSARVPGSFMSAFTAFASTKACRGAL